MKRVLDIVVAAFGLLLLAPLFLVVGLLIRREDGGPVFFRQTRMGRNGSPFRIWKFRTMVVEADRLGPPLTAGQDPRITRIGHWLRRLKLDELPQLLNVWAGEMTLVGPRPEVPEYVALYTMEQRELLKLKPGITCPASLEYFDEAELLGNSDDPARLYVEEIMPEKIRLALAYAARANILTDLRVIVQTLLRMRGGRRTADSNHETADQKQAA